MPDQTRIKRIREEISNEEAHLNKMMAETERLWEKTDLDQNDPNYLVEKTMRFEIAQKNILSVFSAFKDLVARYKSLCKELENAEE